VSDLDVRTDAGPWTIREPLDGTVASISVTGRTSGDLASGVDPEVLARRRRSVVDLPWVTAEQVHGRQVLVARSTADAGQDADALVTDVPGLVVAVRTPDCAPVALLGRSGVVAAVHAGWPGLVAGVIQAAAEAMVGLGEAPERAVLGPCIHAECYEFGGDLLAPLTERYGDVVAATTSGGRPALDVPAAVDAALAQVGVPPAVRLGPGCTACHPDLLWSHRRRSDPQRQALAVWMVAQ
jgi:YfiH family protein